MENIEVKISHEQRERELDDVAQYFGLEKLQEYIALRIEQAYIAGASGYDFTGNSKVGNQPILDHGITLVQARNYVKDKGWRR